MNITTDLAIHIGQIVLLAFYVGVSYSDIKWCKEELRVMRDSLIRRGFEIREH